MTIRSAYHTRRRRCNENEPAATRMSKQRAWQIEMREQGRCASCGGKRQPESAGATSTRCAQCAKRHRIAQQRRRAYLATHER